MKLLTKEIAATLPALYSQENVTDPIVRVKFFAPWNQWKWYATEYDPTEGLFFGLVVGQETELGYFSLAEISECRGPHGLIIERDIYFQPAPLSTFKEK